MDDIYVSYQKSYPNLEKALMDGAKIHVFRSGGGLRVVRVEKYEELISYGEHPYFSGALSHAESDFGLTYKQQYSGENAKHTNYLTGAYPVSYDVFDAYIFGGRTLDIIYSEASKQFICKTENILTSEKFEASSDDMLSAIRACLVSEGSINEENKDFMDKLR